MKKNIILNVLGTFFLIFGVIAIMNSLSISIQNTLWLCYIALILIGFSILKKDSRLLAAQLNLITIPLIFWTLDFISYLILGHSLFGIVDYFFVGEYSLGKIISLQHIFTIPLSLLALSMIGLKTKTSWKISILEISILFIITRIFTAPENNINCVYEACFNFNPPLFGLWWFLGFILIIFVTDYFLVKMFKN